MVITAQDAKLKPGYKQTELGVIPEDWEVKKVGEICDFVVPGRNKPKNFDGDIPWITTPDIEGNIVTVSKRELYLSKEEAKKVGSKIVVKNSVVMSCVGDLGVVAIAGRDIVINQQLHAFLPNETINPYYLSYALSIRKNYMESVATKTAIPYMNKENCNSIPIPFPSKAEQEAIVTVLSDIDALIECLEKLIAKKRDIKQATMRQLLTGKRRLPGFGRELELMNKQTEVGVVPEDWKIEKLENCLLGRPQYGINAPAVQYTDSLPIYIRITDITDDGRFSSANIASVKYVGVNKYVLKAGDLLFARTGASVGKSYLYKLEDGNLVFAGYLIRVKVNPLKLLPEYLAAYVMTEYYWNWVKAMSMRSGQPGINGNEYSQLPIPLPPLSEQKAIATILSDMDSEIATLEQKRDKALALKQGMMQELLTGKTRLI